MSIRNWETGESLQMLRKVLFRETKGGRQNLPPFVLYEGYGAGLGDLLIKTIYLFYYRKYLGIQLRTATIAIR